VAPGGHRARPTKEEAKHIAERLPDDAVVEFTLREDDGVIELRLVELVRKPVKLKAAT